MCNVAKIHDFTCYKISLQKKLTKIMMCFTEAYKVVAASWYGVSLSRVFHFDNDSSTDVLNLQMFSVASSSSS